MSETEVTLATDTCALSLARRLAAMLDRDPDALREGDPLPHGWHALLFNVPTRQSELRSDGAANLGVPLPDIGLPRLMLGGRQTRFAGDIPIGAHLRRETRQGEVQLKVGRSGRFALVKVEHRIFVEDATEAAVVENQDYVLREASGAASAASQEPAPAAAAAAAEPAAPGAVRTIVPDERLLFRYSAITDNHTASITTERMQSAPRATPHWSSTAASRRCSCSSCSARRRGASPPPSLRATWRRCSAGGRCG